MIYLRRFIVYVALALFLSISALSPVFASDVVVVDIQQLEALSIVGKDLRKKIQTKRDALKAEVAKEEKALNNEQKKIMSLKETLSPEEFKVKAQAFDKSFKKKQNETAKKGRAFEKASMEAHSKLREKVVSVVGGIAEEKKYKIVLSRQSVVIVEKSMDITEEAMKRLNKNVKSIPY